MKKLNRKGFTLIESIITFAILAIAGMMFIALFSNVSTLMKEGSFIKTESDEMYNQLVSQSTTDESGTITSLQFKIGEQIYSQDVFLQSTTGTVDDFDMKLIRYVTGTQQIGWLPSEGGNTPDTPGGGEGTDNYIDGGFRFLTDIYNTSGYPQNHQNFINESSWRFTPESYHSIIVKNSISASLGNREVSIFNGDSVENYIHNGYTPSQEQINQIIQNLSYKDELVNGYNIIWYGILQREGGTLDTGYKEIIPVVYGALIPKGKIYFNTDDPRLNGIIINSKEDIFTQLKAIHYFDGGKYTVYVNDTTYTFSNGDMNSGKFLDEIKENNIYFVSIDKTKI